MAKPEEFIEPLDNNDAVAEQVGEALRQAQNNTNVDVKLKALLKAEQLLLTNDHSGHLLDNFLDEMLEFVGSADFRLKCFVANFIEKACKKDAEVMKKAITSLSFLLMSESQSQGGVKIMKRVMIVCSNLYPIVLKWAVGRRSDLEAEKCWEAFCVLKGRIMHHIDSDNEGIRTMTLKFLESIVLAQSLKTEDSECGRGDIISLNDVPRDHRFISYRKMQAEANGNLQSLLDQTTLNHISAQNLLTVISVVCTISRQRPEYMMKVLDCLEVLHVNLPPTLLTSQVKSVRKELKMNLLRMLKHPSALPIHNRIITLLTDLGATQNEMNRAMPINILDLRRKKRPIEGEEPAAKKMKQDENLGSNHLEDDEYADESSPLDLPKDSARQSAIDITADFIFERLNPKVVANLVLISLMTQPDEMPAAFQSSYTPIAAAGTESQRRHLARMMATQATQQELGPGVEQMRKEKLEKFHERQTARREGAYIPPTPAIHASGHSNTSGTKKLPASGMPNPIPAAPKAKQQFNLMSATTDLSQEEIISLFHLSFLRIMNTERRAAQGGAGGIHHLILVRLASRFHSEAVSFEQIMIDFIVDEHKQRTDLALLWVAELYAQYQGFSFCYVQDRPDGRMSSADLLKRYDRVVCGLLRKLFEREQHKEALFHKILLEAPLVTKNALGLLELACLDKVFGAFGMTTLRELVLTRNRQRSELLDLLFKFCFYDRAELKQSCVETVKELCELPYMRGDVRAKLIEQLRFCTASSPPKHFTGTDGASEWDESLFRNALHLFLAVLPSDPTLLSPLAETYSGGITDFKKVILRSVEPAVKAIGMHNVEMLRLVEECPVGAETLVARVVHLLTERNPVTKDLVVRLKKLHEDRNTDVRGLIPVLNGLDKEDIIKILPQFVLKAVNQKSVSLVFRRLLSGRNIETGEPTISAADLIYEYHKIEPSTSEERQLQIDNLSELVDSRALSKESVASAVERLMDLRPLPALFYYSLVVVYKKYPSLDGFLSNVIHKVINKELWVHDDITKNAFFRSLSHLKAVAYTPVLMCFSSDEFKEYLAYGNKQDILRSLKDFLPSLSSHQQRSISSTIMDMIKDRDERREREREERDRDREKERDREERRERERDRKERRDSRKSVGQ